MVERPVMRASSSGGDVVDAIKSSSGNETAMFRTFLWHSADDEGSFVI